MGIRRPCDEGASLPLDIYAYKELQGSSAALRPRLALLIECKRADLPFIFFAPAVPRVPQDFPVICGFARNGFELHKRGIGHREVTAANFLSVQDFDFVGAGPTVSSAFARLERKGKSFDLSGSVPFNSVVLPLMSALDHCRLVWVPVGPQSSYFPVVLLCVGVMDSAMLVARGTPEEPELTLEPWVRVVRQEAVQEHNWWGRRHYVVDFVHRAFVEDYISAHALPFATALADRMLEKQNMVIAGKACVPDWDSWRWQEMEPAT